jgi:hypothetical protein
VDKSRQHATKKTVSMKKLGLISVYLDQNTPAQQLLDRCLTGWPSEGRSFESPFESVLVHGLSRKTLLESRKGATKLVVVDNMKDVLKEVDCWISAPGKENSWACCSQYTQFIADNYGSSKPGWVVGPSGGLSQEVMSSFVKEGRMQVQFSTPLPWTWRLPEQNIPVGADLKEVIVLVRGAFRRIRYRKHQTPRRRPSLESGTRGEIFLGRFLCSRLPHQQQTGRRNQRRAHSGYCRSGHDSQHGKRNASLDPGA